MFYISVLSIQNSLSQSAPFISVHRQPAAHWQVQVFTVSCRQQRVLWQWQSPSQPPASLARLWWGDSLRRSPSQTTRANTLCCSFILLICEFHFSCIYVDQYKPRSNLLIDCIVWRPFSLEENSNVQ